MRTDLKFALNIVSYVFNILNCVSTRFKIFSTDPTEHALKSPWNRIFFFLKINISGTSLPQEDQRGILPLALSLMKDGCQLEIRQRLPHGRWKRILFPKEAGIFVCCFWHVWPTTSWSLAEAVVITERTAFAQDLWKEIKGGEGTFTRTTHVIHIAQFGRMLTPWSSRFISIREGIRFIMCLYLAKVTGRPSKCQKEGLTRSRHFGSNISDSPMASTHRLAMDT